MRSLRSAPSSDGERGGGEAVIARETYRRPTACPSRRCNGIVTTQGAPPGACDSAPGGGPYVSESLLLCGFPDRSPAGGDALQAGLDPGVQLFGERGIPQLRRLGLAVAFGPPDKLDERPCLGGVAVALVDQQPREARDRIRLGPGRVGDRHPEVRVRPH